MSSGRPSRFWEQLSEEHSRDLSTHGLATCKRHQALRYFTWQWSWTAVRQSEQMRFLLRHTPLVSLLRCAAMPARLADEDWEGVPWPKRDRWLYAFATRLLWLYAQAHDPTGTTLLNEPELGQPLPVILGGRRISQDLANSALEVAAIVRALDGRVPSSLLEIGAGYGRTAYALLSRFPEATYTIIDIEPAIEISRWYLSKLFPARRLRFLLPDDANELEDGAIDLALTISSLQEMTPEQLGMYLNYLDRVAAGGVVFLKQWATWYNPVDEFKSCFDDYPIPSSWSLVFKERAPVQTSFIEAAWRVPSGLAREIG
ncbi:MAG: putative sugar O-methyltransferase [Acidimicrobiales bacterium]